VRSTRQPPAAIAAIVAVWAGCGGAAGGDEPGRRERELLREVWPQLTDFAAQPPSELIRGEWNLESGDLTRLFSGNVRRSFRVDGVEVRVSCDHLVVQFPGLAEFGAGRPDAMDSGAARPGELGPTPQGPTPEGPTPEGPPAPAGSPASAAPLDFWFYAGGNVRLEIPERGSVFEAESLYYDNLLPLARLRGVRVRTTVRGLRGLLNAVDLRGPREEELDLRMWKEAEVPVSFEAGELRTRDFRSFQGERLRVSTCDYGEPHYALAAAAAEVDVVAADDAGQDADPDAGPHRAWSHAIVRPRDAGLEVWGSRVVPLGIDHWDTRWHDFLPVRRVELGSSSKFGAFGGVDWNANFFVEQLPLDLAPALERLVERSKVGFETLFLEERGFAWGPFGEFGREPHGWKPWQLRLDGWEYYGEARYFAIRDHGEDRFGVAGVPADPDRYWASLVHRQAVPWLGTIDVEFSERSDANVLGEYFESIAKEEKAQESLVLLRRNFTDNKAVTGLFQYRTDDFEATVERLPEGRFWMLQEPILDSGFYTDLVAQAANLRLRPADGSGFDSTRVARADVVNRWAYPISWLDPWVELRPSTFARLTAYDTVLDPASGGADRFAAGAGITASQQWSRVFETSPDGFLRSLLDIDSVAHLVVPSVSYDNVFTNDLPSVDLVPLDDVESVDRRETLSLSFAQAFITSQRVRAEGSPARHERPLLGLRDVDLERSDHRSWRLLDSDVRLVVFPHPGRDNGGDPTSMLVFDNTLRVHRHVALRSWVGVDPDDRLRGKLIQNSMRAELVPGAFAITVGNLYSDALVGREDSNFVFSLLSLYPGEKWRAQVYWQVDVERGEDAEIGVTLGRVFHRFALLFGYSFDAGEDDNQTFSINFRPLDFFGGDVFDRGSRW